jgi:hypothetical protein
MFEWPYTIYGERWPIWIFYILICFNFIFGQFWHHLIMRMPDSYSSPGRSGTPFKRSLSKLAAQWHGSGTFWTQHGGT